MYLFEGTTGEFISGNTRNTITETMVGRFKDYYRRSPHEAEIRSWRESLKALALCLSTQHITNNGIALEWQLPLSGKRLDAIITGRATKTKRESAIVVELKQWSGCRPSPIGDCVVSFIAGRDRDVPHPSIQVSTYRQMLRDGHELLQSEDIDLHGCAYLHNYPFQPDDPLLDGEKFKDVLKECPIYFQENDGDLGRAIQEKVGGGDGLEFLTKILGAKTFSPAKKLLEHVAGTIEGNGDWTLVDEQLVAYNSILYYIDQAKRTREKNALIIKGGPGTGKSVVAVCVMGACCRRGTTAFHATASRAFTNNLRKVVGRRAATLFKWTMDFATVEANEVPVIVIDEAHRIKRTSVHRFTPKAKRSGKPQVDELLDAALTSVFFIDDQQAIRPDEIGSVAMIREAALGKGISVHEFELETQFRCNGSEAFVAWVETSLGMSDTVHALWDEENAFEVKFFDTPASLWATIKAKNDEGASARVMAGFCWPWSDPTPVGLVNDVKIGDWKMPWNAKPDAGALPDNIPQSHYWATDSNGIHQVGCIYTAQGFEVDYAGVIIGPDLRFDPETNQWITDRKASEDSAIKKCSNPVDVERLVKQAYRVLLSRGMKGCYIHCNDPEAQKFLKSRIKLVLSQGDVPSPNATGLGQRSHEKLNGV